jgi:thioesterase domain-containing protein
MLIMLDSYVADALPDGVENEQLLLAAFAVDLGVDIGFAAALAEPAAAVDALQSRLLSKLQDSRLVAPTFGKSELQQAFARFAANQRALRHYVPGKLPAVAPQHDHPAANFGRATLIRACGNLLAVNAPMALGWQPFIENINVIDVACDHYAVVSHTDVLSALKIIIEADRDDYKSDIKKNDNYKKDNSRTIMEEV